jgi:hypothetical protein
MVAGSAALDDVIGGGDENVANECDGGACEAN